MQIQRWLVLSPLPGGPPPADISPVTSGIKSLLTSTPSSGWETDAL